MDMVVEGAAVVYVIGAGAGAALACGRTSTVVVEADGAGADTLPGDSILLSRASATSFAPVFSSSSVLTTGRFSSI